MAKLRVALSPVTIGVSSTPRHTSKYFSPGLYGTTICSPSTSNSFLLMSVHSVRLSPGHLLAYTWNCRVGVWGSHPELISNDENCRSIFATRRMASPSRGVIPFQMPQMFSQVSRPIPLKKAYCRSKVLLRCHRSDTLVMCRGSSHLYLSTYSGRKTPIFSGMTEGEPSSGTACPQFILL